MKRILQRPSRRVNILGLLPPASEQLEAVREGAFIFAISAIGYSALLRKANAFFVDLTSTPYEVNIGMEYIEGWLLCSVLAPDSAGCLLLNERFALLPSWDSCWSTSRFTTSRITTFHSGIS